MIVVCLFYYETLSKSKERVWMGVFVLLYVLNNKPRNILTPFPAWNAVVKKLLMEIKKMFAQIFLIISTIVYSDFIKSKRF